MIHDASLAISAASAAMHATHRASSSRIFAAAHPSELIRPPGARTSFSKFQGQRRCAAERGIDFTLTFEEWSQVWAESGHWLERGCRRGQYVMARHGDAGPYAVGNVSIKLHEDNCREAAPSAVVGAGRGWTFTKGGYQVMVANTYIGRFKSAADAEAAYLTRCEAHRARTVSGTTQAGKKRSPASFSEIGNLQVACPNG